jgi:hypothetical protein
MACSTVMVSANNPAAHSQGGRDVIMEAKRQRRVECSGLLEFQCYTYFWISRKIGQTEKTESGVQGYEVR